MWISRAFTFIPFILNAGACVFLFLVILGGVKESSPLNNIYFIQANISNFTGSTPVLENGKSMVLHKTLKKNINHILVFFFFCRLLLITNSNIKKGLAHWSLWGVCGVTNSSRSTNCTSNKPAFPFDPLRNFGSDEIPAAFINNSQFFYYMSRFAFAFYIISVFFALLSIFLAIVLYKPKVGAILSTIADISSLVFGAAAASLMTAWVVMAKNDFNNAGHSAKIGTYAMAFSWS